ncbi:hypothetical protein BDV19DRAFT_387547 [Aspergillus venezuelensis]
MYQKTTLVALSSLMLSAGFASGRALNPAKRAACDNILTWVPKGDVASGVGSTAASLRFGDIDGDGRVDYLVVDSDGSVTAYRNQAGSSADEVIWQPLGKIASGHGHDGAGVRFADVNGDGRDDYLWISEEGAVTAYLNQAGDSAGGPIWIPQGEIATGVGASRGQVVFGDINGDGRADYLVVGETGDLEAWLNMDSAVWLPQGKVAAGAGSAAGVRIADIDGDGRADYLWLSETGPVTVFINAKGPSGPIWLPQGEIAAGVGASRDSVVFADVNGDGRSDYLLVGGAGEVAEWQNDAC